MWVPAGWLRDRYLGREKGQIAKRWDVFGAKGLASRLVRDGPMKLKVSMHTTQAHNADLTGDVLSFR